jgi:hypothetical protein
MTESRSEFVLSPVPVVLLAGVRHTRYDDGVVGVASSTLRVLHLFVNFSLLCVSDGGGDSVGTDVTYLVVFRCNSGSASQSFGVKVVSCRLSGMRVEVVMNMVAAAVSFSASLMPVSQSFSIGTGNIWYQFIIMIDWIRSQRVDIKQNTSIIQSGWIE